MNSEKLTLTVPEAAKRLGVGRNTAYEGIKRGEIPSLRIGGRLVVPKVQLERLLSGQIPQSFRGLHDRLG
jgi:excisionase family DNA binding protein